MNYFGTMHEIHIHGILAFSSVNKQIPTFGSRGIFKLVNKIYGLLHSLPVRFEMGLPKNFKLVNNIHGSLYSLPVSFEIEVQVLSHGVKANCWVFLFHTKLSPFSEGFSSWALVLNPTLAHGIQWNPFSFIGSIKPLHSFIGSLQSRFTCKIWAFISKLMAMSKVARKLSI